MKGMFRLALSSYLMVMVASAPALAQQESSLVSTRVSRVDPTLVARSPAPTPVTSVRSATVSRVRLPYASSAAAETLTIVVRGPSQIQASTTAGFRAAVGNAANDSRYYFWWFAANCAQRIG
ncbi:MAG TPA: hypothetical protein VFP15_07205, partial [Gemmatimonadaceae bacterium]|nr:hypothetical protein [Gemmatimonadaceae bacterium]